MAKPRKEGRARSRQPDSAAISPVSNSPGNESYSKASDGEPLPEDAVQGRRVFGREVLLPALGLCMLVALSYIPALLGGFVWDDVIFTEEPTIRDASGLWSIWFSPSEIEREGHYWPIVYTSFWLEDKLWDLAPLGSHAVNVLLHLLNCLLLWSLAGRLQVPGAWAVAAVFAVHPLHVESVAWVIERKDLLSGLFYLAAASLWLRLEAAPRLGTYLSTMVLFVAALLSKSIAVTFPAAMLVVHWWKHGRVKPAEILRAMPFFLVGFCVTAADLAFYRGKDVVSFDYSIVERTLIAARSLWFYAGKLAWPFELPVIYPRWEPDATDILSWAFLGTAIAAVILLWLFRGRIGNGPLAGVSYFALTLSPVLGFVDFSYMEFSFVADRYQYLAGIGLIAVAVGTAARMAAELRGRPRFVARSIGAAAIVFFGAKTWMQSSIYSDQVTFFSHIVSLNPNAKDAYFNLGNALLREGRLEEGLAASRIAVEQRPDSAKAHSNLSVALSRLGMLDEAETHLERARALDPLEKSGLHNTAEMMRKRGQYEEALQWYLAALESDPDYAVAHAGMGDALVKLERYEEALVAMRKARSLNPDLSTRMAVSLHRSMGTASEHLGQVRQAVEFFQLAAEIDSQDPEIQLDLARLRGRQERYEEADEHLLRARELRSGEAAILLKIGDILRLQGRPEQALQTFREVIDGSPENASAHAGMGLALFDLQRHEKAIEALGAALALDPESAIAGSLYRVMGRAYQELGSLDDAVRHFESALAFNQRDADAIDRLAQMQFERRRYADSQRLYQALVEIEPDNAQAHSNLGAALFHLRRAEEAIRSFERAVSIDPKLESAQIGLRESRRILRKPTE